MRVVVTGAGCVTAIGSDLETFQERLFAGQSGICPIPDLSSYDLGFSQAATVPGFDLRQHLAPAQAQIAERCSAFAMVAARQAIAASGVCDATDGAQIAAVFGCSTGGRSAEEPETAKLYTTGGRVHPLTVPRAMASAGTSLVCMEHGITGPAYTVNTACASSTHAIGQAFHMVRSGMVRAAVCGGHEAPLTYGFLKGWDSLHVVSPTSCKPFSAERDGMTLGEGAAVFVLESLDDALARNAPVLAEIVGFGMSSDAHHITQAHAPGPAAAMKRALADARVDAAAVDYVNAHGTGTAVNDRVEAEALYMVFGERARTLPVSSTKGLHGHCIGASGAMELLATVLALKAGMLPANVGTTCVDATLALDGALLRTTQAEPRVALSNSFAFGGLNAVLALRRWDP